MRDFLPIALSRNLRKIRFLLGSAMALAVAGQVAGEPKDDAASSKRDEYIRRLDAESAAAREGHQASEGNAASLAWLQSAVDRGDMYAEFQLSLLYKDGRGVEKDEAKYLMFLKRSATQGYVAAQRRLSGIYEKGKGVPKDLVEAADWAKKAAEQGDAAGIGTLVVDYRYGRGVPVDYVQAVKWQLVGIALGYAKGSDQFTDDLFHQAGESKVAEAKKLAEEWLEAYHKAN